MLLAWKDVSNTKRSYSILWLGTGTLAEYIQTRHPITTDSNQETHLTECGLITASREVQLSSTHIQNDSLQVRHESGGLWHQLGSSGQSAYHQYLY